MKIPLYKDEDFLEENIGNQVYLEELKNYLKEKEDFDPKEELIYFALSYYPDLAAELLKKTKDLPDTLLKQIVQGIQK